MHKDHSKLSLTNTYLRNKLYHSYQIKNLKIETLAQKIQMSESEVLEALSSPISTKLNHLKKIADFLEVEIDFELTMTLNTYQQF